MVRGDSCGMLLSIVLLAVDAVSIGATLPLTGPDAKPAAQMKRGYELAIEEANARGGVQLGVEKRKVRLDLRDDGGSPDKAAALAQQLVNGPAQLLLGSYQDPLVSRQTKISEAAGVPYVYAGSALAAYAGSRWNFGLLSPVDL